MNETVVLCGFTCAGKTAGGIYLSEHFGFRHVEASSIMREFWTVSGDGTSVEEFAARALIETPERVPIEAVARGGQASLVITGLRSPDEVEHVRRLRSSVRVIYVYADVTTRLERSIRRRRPGHPDTLRDLAKLDRIHQQMGVERIATHAGGAIVRNESTIEHYFGALIDVLC